MRALPFPLMAHLARRAMAGFGALRPSTLQFLLGSMPLDAPSHQVSASPRAQVNETGEGVQLALDVGTASAEDDACCAGGLELGEAGS